MYFPMQNFPEEIEHVQILIQVITIKILSRVYINSGMQSGNIRGLHKKIGGSIRPPLLESMIINFIIVGSDPLRK